MSLYRIKMTAYIVVEAPSAKQAVEWSGFGDPDWRIDTTEIRSVEDVPDGWLNCLPITGRTGADNSKTVRERLSMGNAPRPA